MTEFYDQFFCECNVEYSIIIDDDGRVAYAYLYKGNDIIGDVWLYNQAATPIFTHWNQEDMPFLNPKEYIKDEIDPILNTNEVKLEWSVSNNRIQSVLIFIRKNLVARLEPGSTPGWSKCVSKDGPLAKCYE